MPFRFPLASVLRYRETVEKSEETALQRIQFEIARVHGRIEELEAEISQRSESFELAMQRMVHANLMQAMLAELEILVEARMSLSLTLEVLQQQRKAQMRTYQAAHSGRQMLTEMLTQRRDAYELKQACTLQRQLDDVFAARSQASR